MSQFIEMFEDHNYTSVPLAELIDKSFPGEWGTEDENGNGTKVIRTTNITNSDKLDLSDVVTRNIVAAKLQKKQLCKGDILLERSGGTKDNPVGRVAYFDEDGVFVTNNFTQTLRCNDNIESRYLFYFLYYFYNLNKMKIRSMGNQTTGIQNLNMDDYMHISVIVPPRDLQKQFISIVTQADKSKFVGFKSQFIEMFGDVIKNSNDWREYGPIGNYADIVLGSTPDSKNPKYWDGDICWVTPAELNDDVVVINDTVRHITNDGVSAANLTKLLKGSVLFSTRAPIGKVAITGVEMYCNQGFKNFICGDKLNNLYLYYTLKLNRDYLCALGTGTTFKELSKKVVESISIAIPPIEMQNKFEDVFKQADKSKLV